MLTRTDTRYCHSDDPAARLVAYIGELDMGGWLDADADAFVAAVRSEYRFGTGEDIGREEIEIETVAGEPVAVS